MLFALGEPVAFVALVVSFLLALVLRAFAVRVTARRLGVADRREAVGFRPREDIDPFGAVAAAIGGMGWGKILPVDEVPRWPGRGKAIAVYLAGPLANILVAQLFFLAYALVTDFNILSQVGPADVLMGQLGLPFLDLILVSIAVGLLCFGLLALIPIPPLDGFGVMWFANRNPAGGLQGMRLWFEDKNIGVLILLICCLFPLGRPFLLLILDLIGLVFVRLWG